MGSPAARHRGRIYVDLDDVLCHTARAFTAVLWERFGKRVRFEEIRSFDLSESFGLTGDEHGAFMRLAHEPEVLAGMNPVEGGAEALGGWIDRGYEVAVVTGRPPVTEGVTRDWLEAAEIPFHSLIFVDKYSHPGFEPDPSRAISLEELAAVDFRLAIEDSAAMASYLAGTMRLDVLLMDRPWNRALDGDTPPNAGRIVRCRDWSEVVDRVLALQQAEVG